MTYRYVVDFFHRDGSAAGSAPIDPDWTRALQYVHFEGVRRALFPPVPLRSGAAGAGVEPAWHAEAGPPYIAGVRARVSEGDAHLSRALPTTYLRDDIQAAATALVEAGALDAGEVFRYRVSAFPVGVGVAPPPPDDGFTVEDVVAPLPVEDASLSWFLAHSRPTDDADPEHDHDQDLPVFVPQPVLDESLDLARSAGDVETGGILVGKLCRDASVPELFIVVTAFIPASHTQSGATKLTFTTDTWAAARAAITLRRRNETMTGWAHSHVNLCRLRNCPIERQRQCTASNPFFSPEDIHLQRTCFPQPHHIALLTSDSAAEGWRHTLFGWRRGMIAARGFHIVNDD